MLVACSVVDDSDVILSYYQSVQHSSSPSLKSSDGGPSQPRGASPPAGSLTTAALRRTSFIPSQGGTDRRRLAIVEMDVRKPLDDQPDRPEKCTGSSVSGGGPQNNARLVAPLDSLTSPRTVPVSITISHPLPNRSSLDDLGHVPRKSLRDVAIVGTASFPASVPQPSTNVSLKPPLFQIPQSRSPSPGPSEVSDSGCSTNRGRQRKDALAPGVTPIKDSQPFSTPVRTQDIGESKHISEPLAGPIVVNLSPQSPSHSLAVSSPQSSTQDSMSPRTNLSSPLTSSTTQTSPATMPSPYLHYQPGLHATAGPLPPPPQAVFNIDSKPLPPPRPPRHSPIRRKDDIEAMKQVLQLPPHVTIALSTISSSSSTKRDAVSPRPQMTPAPPSVAPADGLPSLHESFDFDLKPSHHVREGAFPPSRICTLDSEAQTSPHEEIATLLPRLDSMDDLVASIGLAIDDMGIMSSCDVPPPTVVEPPRGHEGWSAGKGLEIRRSDNVQLTVSRGHSPERAHIDRLPSFRCDGNVVQGCADLDKNHSCSEDTVPPVPAKNDLPYLDTKSLKNALNIKRFSSLPRTPSLMSLNRPSVGSKRSSGTPSPSVAYSVSQPKLPVRRTKSAHSSAMYFADVTVRRTALERSVGYAHKINELYNCDCGLGDWIAETRYKALRPHSSAKRSYVNASRGPRAPSTSSPSIAPRHISQSSTDSGVTFPRRADAYSATDLAPRAAGDASPPNAPPPLPYPALAAASRPSRASTMIATSSISSSRSAVSPTSLTRSPGSFFASLGRRASIKKEKSLTPPSPAKKLSKSPPRKGDEQSSRLVNLPPVAQSVPGGPRAPPNRMQRSQTIIVTYQNSVNKPSHQRSSTMARRPSLIDGRGSSQHRNSLDSGAEFNRQVDKLAALLPKADRNVLAVYLRRAGRDILAIGQYLEDEKNGTLRYE